MGLFDGVLILLAGLAAGTINTVVGSGTLVTFPTLLALGYPAVVANVSNTVGLVPGSFSGAWGYRRELAGQRGRILRLGAASAVGGLAGALLLLWLPAAAFAAVVPALIGLAVVLVVVQPWLARRLAGRPERSAHGGPLLLLGVTGSGAYGGYFGAAQGVLLLALLGIGLDEPLQRINALKNVAAGVVNLVAALAFVVLADVDWAVAGLIAAGAIVGGQLGATVGRRLPPAVLRGLIVVVGTVAVVALVVR